MEPALAKAARLPVATRVRSHAQATSASLAFKNPGKVEYKVVNLDMLEQLAGQYPGEPINLAFLRNHGIAAKKDLIKILGNGKVKSSLTVEAHAFSEKAKQMLETAGGTATVVA